MEEGIKSALGSCRAKLEDAQGAAAIKQEYRTDVL
jgi:hypothetical protein